MAYYKPLKPLKVERPLPAGLPSVGDRDIFRYNVVVPMAPLKSNFDPKAGWNQKGHKLHSDLIDLLINLPFDHSKPRKGRWGETKGTRWADIAEELADEWERMKVPKVQRERAAKKEARDELQKRIDECLRGVTRDTR